MGGGNRVDPIANARRRLANVSVEIYLLYSLLVILGLLACRYISYFTVVLDNVQVGRILLSLSDPRKSSTAAGAVVEGGLASLTVPPANMHPLVLGSA